MSGSPAPLGDFRLPPIGPDDPLYASARRIWNGVHEARPRWILRCSSTVEVASAVRFAREFGLPLAVRGGGHSFSGYGTCDGGTVLDLSPMAGVAYARAEQVASVGGGSTWGVVDGALAVHGCAIPGGLVSTTGVGGLTLGGGIGWLSRRHGLACDRMVGAEVVTADGAVGFASETENRELFWGLRGGGGNFGIVSRFDFRACPLPAAAEVLGGMVLYGADAASDVLHGCAELAPAMPDELSMLVAFITVPPVPFLPAAFHGSPAVAVVVCDVGAPGAAAERVRRLRHMARPLADLVRRQPYVVQQQMFDAASPAGLRQYGVGANLEELTASTISRLAERAALRPTPLCQIHLHQMGGAVGRVAEEATAYAGRKAAWIVHVIATWTDPADDEVSRRWARDTRDALAGGVSPRTYANFLDDGSRERVRQAYGASKHDRLREIKRRYDPDNLFRLNSNVPPAE